MSVESTRVAQLEWLVDFGRREHVESAFCYPCSPGLYLLTGTRNPTRFQILLAGYTDADHVQEVVDRLESQRTPFLIHSFCMQLGGIPALNDYVAEHYRRVGPPLSRGEFPTLSVFRRTDERLGPAGPPRWWR
jgi:hypothetical protein